ncbi:hypothetical protein ACFX15_032229 [Malus domestica]
MSSPLEASVSPKLTSVVALWPSFLTTYLTSIIVTYLTGVGEISITRAAAIVNIYWGAVGIMPAVMKLLVGDFIGSYGMVLLSRLAFVAVSFYQSPITVFSDLILVNFLVHHYTTTPNRL